MSSKTKWIIIVLVILVLALGVVGIAYITTRKAITGPGGAPSAPPAQGDIASSPKMGRFDLGEFIATSRDDELHYIKIQVVVGYIGNLEQELEESKAELRDAIITILMKLNIQRAKEDYIDKFLHKDIETELNRILGKTTSESRIIRVFIPTFLIN
jgi:flagellar basal body-associated protein FliL